MRRSFCNSNMIVCILFVISMKPAFAKIPTSGSVSDDYLALLDLKRRVVDDPLGIMSHWNDSTHFCDWVGVTCNSTSTRVVDLNLKSQKLIGSIPPSLGNMTYLTEIRLENNQFHGPIPHEFGKLLRLRLLNLTLNAFSGEIPTNISHCNQLVYLNFVGNRFVGRIPYEFFTLTKLERLGFGNNNLTGTIPPWIGNFSSMLAMSFGYNSFQGNIPAEIGRLSRLRYFVVGSNNLTGLVWSSICNITSLKYLSLAVNQLQGTLPPNIGFTLSNLHGIACGANNFTGPIPKSLANISRLQFLDFPDNSLIGMLPDGMGSLKHLERLNFASNRLGEWKNGGLNFITSLVNCTRLRVLALSYNHFRGVLPSSIGNLSTQLRLLHLGHNFLSGSIPFGIGNLINLQRLTVEVNLLSGKIPFDIGKLKNLQVLYLYNNQLTGPIPSSIGNLSLLNKFNLSQNKLEGSIPSSLGQCKSLLVLDLSNNILNGTIPKEVLGLSSLSIGLYLNQNSLTGPLPNEVGNLIMLSELDVSDNKLSGHIPSNIDQCTSMQRLYLGGNLFEGQIPQSLEALKGLEDLNISSNHLFGQIPQFLGKLSSLKYLDLSYNNFEGPLPKEGVFSNLSVTSILGNTNLCDGAQGLHLPPCKLNQSHSLNKRFLPAKVLISVISTITFTFILVSIIIVCFVHKKSRKDTSSSSPTKEFLQQISYLELSKSTNGFSMENLIGSGSFGYVYKGVLSNDGSIIAIKVLNLQQQGASKSFVDECNTLSNIRHRNLLKIITSCSSIDFQGNEFKALVFNFMSNGNLDSWLHPANLEHHQRRLSLIQRLEIAIDIACALDYLHNHCETPIVHCDLKPSNILLDNDMVAHVGDFGLARFMLEEQNGQLSFGQTMSLTLKGSIGYIPPEYGSGGRISSEGDIYSFGILVLEMIIGKRPTDDTFGEGVNIHSFAATALSHGAMNIVDPSIPFKETHQEEENDSRIQERAIMSEEDDRRIMPTWMEECVVSILRIGLSCSSRTPRERTSMNVVVVELQAIKSFYLKFKKAHRFHRYLFP